MLSVSLRLAAASCSGDHRPCTHFAPQTAPKFTPFVVESHGFVSRSALDVLDQLALYGGQVLGCNAYELSGYL